MLHAIRVRASASRTEIAAATGMGRAVVAQRVLELTAAGLVEEEGIGMSTGGRPPRRVRFRGEVGSVLVADLGATSVDVAIATLDGTVLARRSEPADVAAGPQVVLDRIVALFSDLLAAVHDAPPAWGAALGLPGPVEFSRGRPTSPPIMPGWDDFPVRDRLAETLRMPVWIDNDVNIMALGEWRFGRARGHDNVVFMKIGTGIGAGLISDGSLHRGHTGSAGDAGHIQVTDEPVACRCGNTGCLEAVAGGYAIWRDGDALASTGESLALAEVRTVRDLTVRDVVAAATRGDAGALAILDRSAYFVGTTIAAIVNLFNPSMVVLGGGVTGAGDRYLAAIRQAVYRRALPLATRRLEVVPSSLGPMAGVLGAAAMVTDELFSTRELARTLERCAPGSPRSDDEPAPLPHRPSRHLVEAGS